MRVRLHQDADEEEIIRSADGQPVVESAWLEEIKHRIALSDAGQVDEVDADDLHAEIRARYQWDGDTEVD